MQAWRSCVAASTSQSRPLLSPAQQIGIVVVALIGLTEEAV
jgi:hypothetical protein